MSAAPASDRDHDLIVTRHAPERQNGAPHILPAGCCCCCCCCCLHTLGGIAGAVVGSVVQMPSHPVYETDPDSPFPYRRDVFEEDQPLVSPVLVYWLMVLLMVFGTVAVTALWNASGGKLQQDLPMLLGLGFFTAVMILPGLQLLASLFAVIVVAVFYPERSYALRRVARITLYCFAGSVIGLLLMAGCLGVLYVGSQL